MDRSDRFEMVGVIDRYADRARTTATARGYRFRACSDTLTDVAWVDEVDAVTIATAPMAHHAIAAEALARGKHVLTEKSFTMSVAEVRTCWLTRAMPTAGWRLSTISSSRDRLRHCSQVSRPKR